MKAISQKAVGLVISKFWGEFDSRWTAANDMILKQEMQEMLAELFESIEELTEDV